MTQQLPALYAIQYSEFDINKGAYVYYEVGCEQGNNLVLNHSTFRQQKQILVKVENFILYEILFVQNRI